MTGEAYKFFMRSYEDLFIKTRHPQPVEDFLQRLNVRFPASNAGKIMELKTLARKPQEFALTFYNRVSQLVEDTGSQNEPEFCIKYIEELGEEVWDRVYQEVFIKYGEEFKLDEVGVYDSRET